MNKQTIELNPVEAALAMAGLTVLRARSDTPAPEAVKRLDERLVAFLESVAEERSTDDS